MIGTSKDSYSLKYTWSTNERNLLKINILKPLARFPNNWNRRQLDVRPVDQFNPPLQLGKCADTDVDMDVVTNVDNFFRQINACPMFAEYAMASHRVEVKELDTILQHISVTWQFSFSWIVWHHWLPFPLRMQQQCSASDRECILIGCAHSNSFWTTKLIGVQNVSV